MAKSAFVEQEYRVTLRFVQGYRFLDLCGEALINLERSLREGWIPGEVAPKGGNVRNDTLGMKSVFNSEFVTVQQDEFVSFEVFRDQACKLVDVLRTTFRIERFISPALAVVFQQPFASGNSDDADRVFRELELVVLPDKLRTSVGGAPASLNFALLTHGEPQWRGVPVRVIRRIEGKVVKQVSTQPFDDRLLRRASFLPEKQQQALVALQRLRAMHPARAETAIEIQLETWLEGEIDKNELSLYDFLTEVHDWASTAITKLTAS
jgi:hypothetical protein